MAEKNVFLRFPYGNGVGCLCNQRRQVIPTHCKRYKPPHDNLMNYSIPVRESHSIPDCRFAPVEKTKVFGVALAE